MLSERDEVATAREWWNGMEGLGSLAAQSDVHMVHFLDDWVGF
jgi:hypothetical protein